MFIALALLFAISSAHAATSCNYISGGNYTTTIPAFETNIPVWWETLGWNYDVVANPTASDCVSVGGTCAVSCAADKSTVIKLPTPCPGNKVCCAADPWIAVSVSTDLGSTWSGYFTQNLANSNTYAITAIRPNPSSNISVMAQLITHSALLSPRLNNITLYSGPRLTASQGDTREKCWPVSVEYTCKSAGTKYYNGMLFLFGSIEPCDSSGYKNQTVVQANLNATEYTENNYSDNTYSIINAGWCSSWI
jgi:hypothetical protein